MKDVAARVELVDSQPFAVNDRKKPFGRHILDGIGAPKIHLVFAGIVKESEAPAVLRDNKTALVARNDVGIRKQAGLVDDISAVGKISAAAHDRLLRLFDMFADGSYLVKAWRVLPALAGSDADR